MRGFEKLRPKELNENALACETRQRLAIAAAKMRSLLFNMVDLLFNGEQSPKDFVCFTCRYLRVFTCYLQSG